jgi:hypothetical protein
MKEEPISWPISWPIAWSIAWSIASRRRAASAARRGGSIV